MPTIANLTVKTDGTMDGNLATLTISAPIQVVPNSEKASENAPDYRIFGRTGYEIGAGWKRMSRTTGAEYVSITLSSPEIGTIYGNLAPAPGGDPTRKVIIWNGAN